MKKYQKGEFPYTVLEVATGKLYVRRSFTLKNGKQKQVWRLCEPPTEKRVNEVLLEIEGGLFEIFNGVKEGRINFHEFKKKVSKCW